MLLMDDEILDASVHGNELGSCGTLRLSRCYVLDRSRFLILNFGLMSKCKSAANRGFYD